MVSDARKQPHGDSATPQEGSNYARKQPRSDTATPHRRAASLRLSGCYSGRSLPGGLFLAAILLAALFLAEYLRLDLKIKGVG